METLLPAVSTSKKTIPSCDEEADPPTGILERIHRYGTCNKQLWYPPICIDSTCLNVHIAVISRALGCPTLLYDIFVDQRHSPSLHSLADESSVARTT